MAIGAPRSTLVWTVSDEVFIEAVKGAISYSEIARRLGGIPHNCVRPIRVRILEMGDLVDTSCLIGRKGVSQDKRKRYFRKPFEELVENSTRKLRLKDEFGVEYVCSRCGIDEWLGESISLELHHVDGNNLNNRIQNICWLCPNCHALTSTWRGRNRARERIEKTWPA